MKRLIKSKIASWCAFIIVLALVVASLCLVQDWKEQWWTLLDEFFAFMMVFCQLVAVYLARFNTYVCRRLQAAAAISGVLMLVSFIVEYVLLH